MKRIFLDKEKEIERVKRLEEISVGDYLFFPERRIERVIEVNLQLGRLHTERREINSDENYDTRIKIVYELAPSNLILSNSVGNMYSFENIPKSEWKDMDKIMIEKRNSAFIEGAYK